MGVVVGPVDNFGGEVAFCSTVGCMRMKNRGVVVAILACTLVLAALSGCTPTPAPTPIPSSTTAAPVFESDEEALAAATEAYAAYLKASDASGGAGTDSRSTFLALTVGEAHKDDLEAEKLFDDRGWKKVGTTTFDTMQIQSSSFSGGQWEVRTYLCLDVSATDVLDQAGASVVKADRPKRLPLEVAFTNKDDTSKTLLVSESKVWSGSDYC